MKGTSGHVVSLPLAADLRAKTLEAWVKLDTLSQRGGAVMTVQTIDPDPGRQVFDAIVFGEREEGRWKRMLHSEGRVSALAEDCLGAFGSWWWRIGTART